MYVLSDQNKSKKPNLPAISESIPEMAKASSTATISMISLTSELKLNTTFKYPDYEDILTRVLNMKGDFVRDLLIFPENDITYSKLKIPPTLEWNALYGVNSPQDINHVGRKNISILSSDITYYQLNFNYLHYRGSFGYLATFKPTNVEWSQDGVSSVQSTYLDELFRPVSVSDAEQVFETIFSGTLNMYPIILDLKSSIDDWVNTKKPKPKHVTLSQCLQQSTCRLIIRKADKESEISKHVFMVDSNSYLKRCKSVKAHSFMIQLNNKIIIFSANNQNTFDEWINHISRAAGIIIEETRIKPALNYKGELDIRQSWSKSNIPEIVEYSKETETGNQEKRNESRMKLYHLYDGVFDLHTSPARVNETAYIPKEAHRLKIFFEFIDAKMCVSYNEPYLISFFILNLSDNTKLTEDFICNPLNEHSKNWSFPQQGYTPYDTVVAKSPPLEHISINSCVFNLPSANDSYYLIARFFKIFTSDLEKLWECYMKSIKKYDAKLGKLFLETNETAKQYLMPVGFSFRQLFCHGKLENAAEFSQLIKHEYRYSYSDMAQIIKDYNESKSRVSKIDITLVYNIKMLTEEIPCLSSSMEGIKPFHISGNKISREIEFFSRQHLFKGYPNPINLLFVSLQTINNISLLKGKSLSICMELYQTEKTADIQPLPLIYSRSSKSGFVKSISSSIIFNTGTVNLIDEFKILLPATVMPDLHILFTLRSIYYKELEDPKKKKSLDEIIAYCWIKLFDKTRIIDSKTYNISLSAVLPTGYLKMDLTHPEKLKTFPECKLIDSHGKCSFKTDLNFITNIHAQNLSLSEIMQYFGEYGLTPASVVEIKSSLKKLHSLEVEQMIIHMNTIFNFLFDLLLKSIRIANSAKDKISDLQKSIVELLLLICEEISLKERDDLLRGYVKNFFNPKVQGINENIHDILVEQFATSLNLSSDRTSLARFIKTFWFFSKIIIKSIGIQAAITKKTIVRNNSIKKSTVGHIIQVISILLLNAKNDKVSESETSKTIIRHISRFLIDCFGTMDRGVAFNILSVIVENFDKNTTHEIYLKFQVLIHVSNYEHFVCLNLPTDTPSNETGLSKLLRLNDDYCKSHFPLWLIIKNFQSVIGDVYQHREYGIRLIRNILIKHSFDDRYTVDEKVKRIHILYLPIVTTLLDMAYTLENYVKQAYSITGSIHQKEAEEKPKYTKNKAVTTRRKKDKPDVEEQEIDEIMFRKGDLIETFLIFLSIVKSIDVLVIMKYIKLLDAKFDSETVNKLETVSEFSKTYTDRFITMLRLSLIIFQDPDATSVMIKSTGAILADKISKNDTESIKTYKSFISNNTPQLYSSFRQEAFLIVLDFADKIYFTNKAKLQNDKISNDLLQNLVNIYLFVLKLDTTVLVKRHLFAILRQVISNSFLLLFKGSNSICYNMFYELFKLYETCVESVKREAVSLAYLLFRSDYYFTGMAYLRSYISAVMAISKIVEEIESKRFLFDFMSELTDLVKADHVLKVGEFALEISEFTKRTKNIIRLVHKFEQVKDNPESSADSLCSIANSFSRIPELRQSWLNRLAILQENLGNYSESGMCHLHASAIIAFTLSRKGILPLGPAVFNKIAPNVMIDEIMFGEDALTDQSKHNLLAFINSVYTSAEYFQSGDRCELVSDLSKITIPLMESIDSLINLKKMYTLLADSYTKRIDKDGKRLLGTYYRVIFYGMSFEEDHGCAYIYKEPNVTKLDVIMDRLKNIYTKRCKTLNMLFHSNLVKWKNLDQNMDYIQIVAVDPICEDILKANNMYYMHENVNKFVLTTPFTKNGKAHGDIAEQWQRRTIYTTSHSFPYITKRIPIIHSEVTELSPIEVGIQQIKNKVNELKYQLERVPTDKISLQLKLQGAVDATVNQGPIAFANVFVKEDVRGIYPKKFKDELKGVFVEFIDVCDKGLALNSKVIVEDQIEYHKSLFAKFCLLRSDLINALGLEKTENFVSEEL